MSGSWPLALLGCSLWACGSSGSVSGNQDASADASQGPDANALGTDQAPAPDLMPDADPLAAGMVFHAERIPTDQQFGFGEGPVWLPNRQSFVFADFAKDTIFELTSQGEVRSFRSPAGKPAGTTVYMDSILLTAESEGRVTRTQVPADPTALPQPDDTEIVASGIASPNDLVVLDNGIIFVSAFTSGELWRIDSQGQKQEVASTGLANGVALSPDQETLYLGSKTKGIVLKFTLDPQTDTLENPEGETLLRLRKQQGAPFAFPFSIDEPDGIAVDIEGKLYVAGADKILIANPDGSYFGAVIMPDETTATNLAFGGPEMKTLFITGHNEIFKVELPIKGLIH